LFDNVVIMDAILATVASGGQAIVDTDREAGRNELISHITA
jgi:hypothetical protein